MNAGGFDSHLPHHRSRLYCKNRSVAHRDDVDEKHFGGDVATSSPNATNSALEPRMVTYLHGLNGITRSFLAWLSATESVVETCRTVRAEIAVAVPLVERGPTPVLRLQPLAMWRRPGGRVYRKVPSQVHAFTRLQISVISKLGTAV
jgi:hypothetical protein